MYQNFCNRIYKKRFDIKSLTKLFLFFAAWRSAKFLNQQPLFGLIRKGHFRGPLITKKCNYLNIKYQHPLNIKNIHNQIFYNCLICVAKTFDSKTLKTTVRANSTTK